jgi:hypothetical protein
MHPSELVVWKSSDDVAALLLRIRTMKWQAVTVLATSSNGLAREEAAALVATLDGIVAAVRNKPEPEAIKAAGERIDALARFRDHAPRTRAVGRS